MVLLSSFAGTAHHAVPALLTQLPRPDAGIPVTGTLSGTYTEGKAAGAPVKFKGSGDLTPYGHTTVSGSFSLSTIPASGSVTLKFRKGNIVVRVSESSIPHSPVSGDVSYTVTKGTKQFKHLVGTGTGTISIVGESASKGTWTLTASLMVTVPTV
jgi:hypothetical protein